MTRSSAPLLSVIVLTLNEERNLPGLLASLGDLDTETFVVDSGSEDMTRGIAERAGCTVVEHPFKNYAQQFNWAINNLPASGHWVLRLDADERLSPTLVEELATRLPDLSSDITGVWVKRRFYFWGRWIRRGGYYPIWLLRVWRNGSAYCEDRWMDEHMILKSGATVQFENDIIHEDLRGLGHWIAKHNWYAEREVKDLLSGQTAETLEASAGRVRRLKTGLYYRLPLFLRPFLYWFYRYFLRLGFLDGRPGLVFHFLHAFWYRFLVDARLFERRREA